MPRFDGSGPMGQGPMTGRGLGSCNAGFSRGGRCRGFGWRRFFSPQEEKKDLESYREELKAELEVVEKELEESK